MRALICIFALACALFLFCGVALFTIRLGGYKLFPTCPRDFWITGIYWTLALAVIVKLWRVSA